MENYNEMLENLFDAISTIVEERVRALSFDRTVEATVVMLPTGDEQLYTVYDGSTYYRVAPQGEMSYQLDDVVYILIPENDFNKTKFIIGKKF